jgi:Phosphotransferase enzyme family
VRLPQTLNELTADWLTDALGSAHPGTKVTSVHFGAILHGTNTKVRLLLAYNEAGHSHRLPPTLLAKCGFEVHSALVAECARSEVIYYRERAANELVNAPKCYFAGLDEKSGNSFLLLEDLLARNVTFGFGPRPIDPQTATRAVEMLGRYHARWWHTPGITRREITSGATVVTDVWLLADNFERCTHMPRFEFVPPPLRNRERFRSAIYHLWDSNARGPLCILHGDLHLGNCFFDVDGTPGFLDGQGDTRGCWAHDFTEFLMTALDIDARRTHERPLLELYLEQLRSHGIDAPSFETAWRQYRRNTIWAGTAAFLPVEFQNEVVCTAYTQRAMAAVTDLDALALLEE